MLNAQKKFGESQLNTIYGKYLCYCSASPYLISSKMSPSKKKSAPYLPIKHINNKNNIKWSLTVKFRETIYCYC